MKRNIMKPIMCPYCNSQVVDGMDSNLGEIIPGSGCEHLLAGEENISEEFLREEKKEIEQKIKRWEECQEKEHISFEYKYHYIYIYPEDAILGEIVRLYRKLLGDILESYITNYLPENNYRIVKRYILSPAQRIEEEDIDDIESEPSYSIDCLLFYFFEDPNGIKKDIKEHFELISAIEVSIPVNIVLRMRQFIDEITQKMTENSQLSEEDLQNMSDTKSLLYPEFSVTSVTDVLINKTFESSSTIMFQETPYIHELWKLKRIDNSIYNSIKHSCRKYKEIKTKVLSKETPIGIVYTPLPQELLDDLNTDVVNALMNIRRAVEDCIELIINKYKYIVGDEINFIPKVIKIFNNLKNSRVITPVDANIIIQDIISLKRKCDPAAHGTKSQRWRSLSERIMVLQEVLRLWTFGIAPRFIGIMNYKSL